MGKLTDEEIIIKTNSMTDTELRAEINRSVVAIALGVFGNSSTKFFKAWDKFFSRFYLDHDIKLTRNIADDDKILDTMSRDELEKGYMSAKHLNMMYYDACMKHFV